MSGLLSLFPPGSGWPRTACSWSVAAAPTSWPRSSVRRCSSWPRRRCGPVPGSTSTSSPRAGRTRGSCSRPRHSRARRCNAGRRGRARTGRRGRRRDRHGAQGRCRPGTGRAARQRQVRRGDRARRRARHRAGRGGQLRRRRPPGGRGAGRPPPTGPGAGHPRRHRGHPQPRADRPRGLQVRAGPGRSGRADQAHRSQPAVGHARAARPRRLPDPGRRTVRGVGGTGRRARRVPDVRPGWRSRGPIHLGRRGTAGAGLPRRAGRRGARAPAGRQPRSSSNPAAAWSPPRRRPSTG